MKQSLFAVPIVFLFLLALFAQDKQLTVPNAVNRPERAPFQQQHLKLLKVPEGFTINVFATGTGKPRMMAVSDDGTLYVTRPDQSDVITLRDKNGDGTSDETKTIVKDLKGVHGITIRGNQLYLCTVRELYQCDMNGQGLRKLISDLPEGGNIRIEPLLSVPMICSTSALAAPAMHVMKRTRKMQRSFRLNRMVRDDRSLRKDFATQSDSDGIRKRKQCGEWIMDLMAAETMSLTKN